MIFAASLLQQYCWSMDLVTEAAHTSCLLLLMQGIEKTHVQFQYSAANQAAGLKGKGGSTTTQHFVGFVVLYPRLGDIAIELLHSRFVTSLCLYHTFLLADVLILQSILY